MENSNFSLQLPTGRDGYLWESLLKEIVFHMRKFVVRVASLLPS